jgi:hypothetical protein
MHLLLRMRRMRNIWVHLWRRRSALVLTGRVQRRMRRILARILWHARVARLPSVCWRLGHWVRRRRLSGHSTHIPRVLMSVMGRVHGSVMSRRHPLIRHTRMAWWHGRPLLQRLHPGISLLWTSGAVKRGHHLSRLRLRTTLTSWNASFWYLQNKGKPECWLVAHS